MLKTKSALLLILAIALAGSALAQSPDNVTVKVTVVDKDLNLKNVPKIGLVIRRAQDATFSERRIFTSFDGSASLSLPAGKYVVLSEKPIVFEGRSLGWEQPFSVDDGKTVSVELSNDNAKIVVEASDSVSPAPRRRISREGELFTTLRDGVVTIEGELGSGTGFIFDAKGLVLTNQHVINKSNEIRVRFDRHTAVRARLLAEDVERDLAVLQINLSAFPGSRVLATAETNAAEPPVIEGEHVFTIGSPLHQEKILSSGIVSKVEARAIISDIAINYGNSGGPLFNSLGEVVGLTTFVLKGDDGPGVAGIIRIEETGELVAKAREIAATKGIPSGELMPNIPDGVFPVETIKTALSAKNFPKDQYISDVKDYQIKFMTPVYKFYAIEKDRIESLKSREKRNKAKGLDTADMFRDLHYWNEYAGELRPVVDILALPETTATGKSLVLSAVSAATIGYSTPLAYKYKADFYQMKLMCDGSEVIPLRRNKTELARDLQNYYKSRKLYTYAGVYTYPYEIFAPGRCRQMQVQVFSEENIEDPVSTTTVNDTIRNRVWNDFSDFRRQIASARP